LRAEAEPQEMNRMSWRKKIGDIIKREYDIFWVDAKFVILWLVCGLLLSTLVIYLAQLDGKSPPFRTLVSSTIFRGWIVAHLLYWLWDIKESAVARLKSALRLTRVKALALTGFLMIALLLFPPYIRKVTVNIGKGEWHIVNRQWGFLFDPPRRMDVDVVALFIELLLVAVVGGVLYLFSKKETGS